MKSKVIRELTLGEVKERLEEERNQLSKLKMNHAVSPLENPQKIKDYRKTIARLETDLKRRMIEAENDQMSIKD
jgi:large subunit ribosomal protein L29